MIKQFRYISLFVFLISILLIVYLQFNSGRSIKNLIEDNKSLLSELQIKTKLQDFQSEIIYEESALRDLVTTNDSDHLEEVNNDVSSIQVMMLGIDSTINANTDSKLIAQLDQLTKNKVENTNQAIQILKEKGTDAALTFIRTLKGRSIRDSIINTINLISMNRQIQLSGINASISTNGTRAKSWGIVLAIIACLSCMVTFWYLIVEGQRQQNMIKALNASEQKIKQASKIREQFVANISHEIRTPMNAVLGFTGLLQKTALDKNQHEYVRSIKSSAENLLTIINDILDLSRIESGMLQIEKVPFNLRELLDSLVTMLTVKAKSRGLFLKTKVDDQLPIILKGDAIRLTQILMNLISNGIKFTHQGGITVDVQQEKVTDEKVFVKFIITDTGIGIDPEKQKHVFERFQQADADTTRRYGGTGLGLSIVKQLVDIQNGEIDLQSEQGKGSVFTVSLPYEVASPKETNEASEIFLPPDRLFEKTKLLVAEDNAMNRQLLTHLLRQWEAEFDMVENGKLAVDALRQNPSRYSVVLMDIQMPEMDGYTATDKIRHELNLSIPIIAMTAHALTGEKEKCLNAGMDDYISKPLNEELLYSTISKHAQYEVNGHKPVINIEYLRSLSKGDRNFEKDMIETFTSEIPLEIIKLKNAIDNKDYGSIRSLAHSMRSTVGYMGLNQLIEPLTQMESDASAQNGTTSILHNFSIVNNTCQLALKEAEELI